MARLMVDLYTQIVSPLRFKQNTPKHFAVSQGRFMAAVNYFRSDARGDRLKAVDDALIQFHCCATHGGNYKTLRRLTDLLKAALDSYIKAKEHDPKDTELGRRRAAEALRGQVLQLLEEMRAFEEVDDFRNRPDGMTGFQFHSKVDMRAIPCVPLRGATLFERPSGLPS